MKKYTSLVLDIERYKAAVSSLNMTCVELKYHLTKVNQVFVILIVNNLKKYPKRFYLFIFFFKGT